MSLCHCLWGGGGGGKPLGLGLFLLFVRDRKGERRETDSSSSCSCAWCLIPERALTRDQALTPVGGPAGLGWVSGLPQEGRSAHLPARGSEAAAPSAVCQCERKPQPGAPAHVGQHWGGTGEPVGCCARRRTRVGPLVCSAEALESPLVPGGCGQLLLLRV